MVANLVVVVYSAPSIYVKFVAFYGRVRRLQIKISYAQNNQEHAMGDGSQIVTTRRAVPCNGSRVEATRYRSRLLLAGLPLSRSDPANRFTGAAQVHRL